MDKMVFKIGRFAYLLPYAVMPAVAMICYDEPLADSILLTFAFPYAIESYVILIYPVCWLFSLISFILCFIAAIKSKEKKSIILNIVFAGITVVWTVLHIIIMVLALSQLTLVF